MGRSAGTVDRTAVRQAAVSSEPGGAYPYSFRREPLRGVVPRTACRGRRLRRYSLLSIGVEHTGKMRDDPASRTCGASLAWQGAGAGTHGGCPWP